MGKVFSKITEARACIFSMSHCLVVPYINLAPGSKLTKHRGSLAPIDLQQESHENLPL